MTTNTFKPCCVTGFMWDGAPEGREEVLDGLPTYVTGDNPDKAVLYVHDALGWRWKNARLLADCYAREVGAAFLSRRGDGLSAFERREDMRTSRMRGF